MKSFLILMVVLCGLKNCNIPETSKIPIQKDSIYSFKNPSPDGIGKLYMGREIAHIMGAEGADWLERNTRQQEENTNEAIQRMGLSSTDIVADIGAGTGYYTFKIAQKVSGGKVYAVDVQDEMIQHLNKKTQELNISNVEVIKGSSQSPNLPDNSVDFAIMVDVYHELEYPHEMLQALKKALKNNGKILLLEYKAEDAAIAIKPHHKMSVEQANKELSANGFTLFYKSDFLPMQHFLLYKKKPNNPFQNNNENKDTSEIIKAGATLQQISNQFSFTEGPAVDMQGNIFFTDQPNDKIWQYGTDGKLSLFLNKTGRSNGLFFNKNGSLLACADEKNELWLIDKNKKINVLIDNYKGKRLNGPNDLWVDAKGGIYITDPYYQRPYWTRTAPEITGQNVYYLPKGRKELITEDSSLKQPNGIAGTADGKYLFVADLADNKTYKYTIEKNGTLSSRKLFVEQGSDGMTLDNRGNVYLTGNGVTVYNADGKKIEHIAIPDKWTANVCFGGQERNKLFITASESIFVLDMKVKGVE